jgi:protein O-GlcNAc transferase
MDSVLADAMAHYRRGSTREAELACEKLLADARDNADALMLLAEIHLASGRMASAVDLLTRLTELRPADPATRRRLGGALLALGRPRDAVDVLRAAIAIEPGSTRAHNNLGQALLQLGELGTAIACYETALRLDPGYAIAHNNRGLALTETGDLEGAADAFRRAAALDPTLAMAWVNLAIVHAKLGQLPDALRHYEQALALAPRLFEAWAGRASVLTRLCRFEAALTCFGTALTLRPADAATLASQAFVLLSMERTDAALASADQSLRAQETGVDAHNVRAGALRKLNRHAEALRSLERALELDPGHVAAWCARGLVLHEMGDFEAATASYRKALDQDPNCVQARTRLLASLIPSVPLSQEESMRARGAFAAELAHWENWLGRRDLDEEDALTAAGQQFFYLSYEEESNRAMLERYRGAAAALLERQERFPRVTHTRAASSPRLKLGFVSAQLFDHSVFTAILQGWLHCLDRSRFEIHLFSVGLNQDALTQAARASVDHFESGARPMAEWARAIGERDLDALIYPEIGMNETTLVLASLRLARRQFAAWGHPETSGLPTIDYYLSAELFEPPDAQDHYTERLVRLPNLGVHCRPYAMTPTPVDFTALGIPHDRPVLICPGVPFKYRPQDDWIFVQIARHLERCTFVFFNHEKGALSQMLQARICAAFGEAHLDAAQYLVSIPWQPRPAFFGLLRQADVYLDTIGFSGFNTLMQAVECRLPCVAYEGRFLRGRLGSGILRRLGLTEWVAADREGYVDRAVQLAAGAAHRSQVRDRMRLAEDALYEDVSAVKALSELLLQEST